MADDRPDRIAPRTAPAGERSGYVFAITLLVLGLVAGIVMVHRHHFLLYHTLIELVGIGLVWSVFLLIWTGRRHLNQEALLILAIGVFTASILGLLHTVSFRGLNLVGRPGSSDVSTQFWMAARGVEAVSYVLFAVWINRRIHGVLVLAGACAVLVALVLCILRWNVFPHCHDAVTGLTTFKIVGEYTVVALAGVAAWILYRRRRDLDTTVHRLLQVMFMASIVAELAFTTYNDVTESTVVLGHVFRVLADFALFLAIVHVTMRRPQALLFQEIGQQRERLAASEQRWRSLAENNPDHIVELDRDLIVRYANFPAPGLQLDDLLGSSVLEFISTEDRDQVAATLAEVLATGVRDCYETRFVAPDGQLIIYETTAVARRDDGEVVGLTLVARNITERKAGEQLRAAHARISHFALGRSVRDVLQKVLDEAEILTGSDIGFFHFVDPDQEHLELQAWSTHTLTAMCTAEGAGLHYAVSDAGVWADCIRQRGPIVHNDYAALPDRKGMPDGHATVERELVVPVVREDRVVAVVGVGNKQAPYTDADVALMQELADLAWDVVLRKRTEAALAESERRLVRTMENLPGMVYRCRNDEHWTMEFVSQGCRDLTGYDADQIVDNQSVSYNDLILAEDQDAVRAAVEAGLAMHDSFQMIYRIRRRDGRVIWVWEQGRGVFFNDRLQALEGFIYDISVQIDAQDERQRLERKVLEAQKLESLGVLAGGIAHDFNNLLQIIIGNTQLALMDRNQDDDQTESLQQVLTASRRAADLTGQMLAYSGHASFVTELVDLSALVQEMVDLLRSSIPRSIALHCDFTPEAAVIEAGPAQIQQVVLNLVTNAAEAVEAETGTVTITTDVCDCSAEDLSRGVAALYPDGGGPKPGRFVRLAVHDTGHGMDDETLSRLFDPFFTTKFTGRGLGLAAVQGILRGHHGTMRIETSPGSTTFEVLLPCHDGVQRGPHSAGDAEAAPREHPLAGRRILVVDDERDVRAHVGQVIERVGGRALPAADGQEALDHLAGPGPLPAAVVLDLTMPRMGGQSCYQALRNLHPTLPVLVMSGYSADELQRRFPSDHATAFISKPFEHHAFVQALEALLADTPPA